nr:MAG TPA: hypothetical protein [Caudoviricetes sp.]
MFVKLNHDIKNNFLTTVLDFVPINKVFSLQKKN